MKTFLALLLVVSFSNLAFAEGLTEDISCEAKNDSESRVAEVSSEIPTEVAEDSATVTRQ